MGISKLIFFMINSFVMSCWLAFPAHSQIPGGGESLPCIQKLLPCQAYLTGSAAAVAATPAAACCVPLKEMVVSNTQCLCAVFNNEAILKTLNVTKDDALKLAKTCGAKADISVCSKEAAPPASSSSSSSSSIPVAPSTDNMGPPKQNAGAAVSHAGRSLLSVLVISFIVSIY